MRFRSHRRRLGHYLNADEIQLAITSEGFDVSAFPFALSQIDIKQFWAATEILPANEKANVPSLFEGRVHLDSPQASYVAAAIAELLRQKLLTVRAIFF